MKKLQVNFTLFLMLLALIPTLLSSVILTGYISNSSAQELKSHMHDTVYTLAESQGKNLYDVCQNTGTQFALSTDTLSSICSETGIKGIDSSYCYVADANAVMLFHPTADKIGQPVSNSTILDVCAQMQAGNRPATDVVAYNFNGVTKYAGYYVAPDLSFVFVISADEEEVLAGAKANTQTAVIMAIICLVLIGALIAFLSVIYSKPLKQVAVSLQTIGSGKFTEEIVAKSSIKEINAIIECTTGLQSSLIDALGTVNTNSNLLSAAIENVSSNISNSVDGVTQINDAINEVADTSQMVAQSSQLLNSKAFEMGDAIESITSSILELRDTSNKIGDVNSEANASMEEVIASGYKSIEAVQTISDKIDETNEAVSQITACVEMITDISSQTNLLSLNASIEAARAGEAGRGFAVVAEEIRQLADDSAKSASEIEKIISSVSSISSATVQAAQGVFEVIKEEQESVKATQEKFTELSYAVTDSLNNIATIQGMSENLYRIKAELVDATSDLSAISEELGASAEEVSASCTTVTNECQTAASETTAMTDTKHDLQSAISVFEIA